MNKNVTTYLYCEKFSNELYEDLKKKYKVTIYKDIYVIKLDIDQFIILFKFGTYICWNVNFDNTKFFNDFLKNYQIDTFEKPFSETFKYAQSDEFKILLDEIFLSDDSIQTKISISAVLAQNIKLEHFENLIEESINKNSSIPMQLSKTGKISLSKKNIAKKVGELFIVKSKINLHYDLLDTPDFFWEYPQYESYYEKLSKYFEIKQRVEVLNKKAEVIHELLDMLSHEQNHKYSSFLEWIIIILIAIEIVMGLWEHFIAK